MYQKHDGENGWRWTPISTADCSACFSRGLCDLTALNASAYEIGVWYAPHITEDDTNPNDHYDNAYPNQEQMDTVTCREYTQCWKKFGDEIDDSRVSKTCEPFEGLDVTYGCKRYQNC